MRMKFKTSKGGSLSIHFYITEDAFIKVWVQCKLRKTDNQKNMQYLVKYGLTAEVLKDPSWTKDGSKADKGDELG